MALTSTDVFNRQLAFGQIAESKIAYWLRNKGHVIIPIYDIEYHTGKGPQVFWGESQESVAPDLLTIHGDRVSWIEAKHKTVFSWHRITQRWVTGIDRRHYRDYRLVAEKTKWPIWLLFLHKSSVPSAGDLRMGSPERCPAGLYGGELFHLLRNENHQHGNHGNSGMVYWAESSLSKLAEPEELE